MAQQPPIHLFIDTNVFLSFYAFTNDDIEQLKKIVGLIGRRRLTLYLTSQVQDEFFRNREIKLAESMKQFTSATQKSMPRYMAAYDEAPTYQRSVEEIQKARDSLDARARQDAEGMTLAADILFANIVKAAGVIEPKQAELNAAYHRMSLNNPPGKKGSLGDRLNWEQLLSRMPNQADLHIVSKDGDFASPLNDTRPHQFLAQEWRKRKQANLVLHTELRPFLNAQFPEIKFAVDIEKREAIDDFKHSGNFNSTHAAIARLEPLVDALTDLEAVEVLQAATSNSQIRWIGGDADVRNLIQRIVGPRVRMLDPILLEELAEAFKLDSGADDEGEEVPF
jgi:hypothetical protein